MVNKGLIRKYFFFEKNELHNDWNDANQDREYEQAGYKYKSTAVVSCKQDAQHEQGGNNLKKPVPCARNFLTFIFWINTFIHNN